MNGQDGSAVVLVVGAAIERAEVSELSDCLRTLLAGNHADFVICDVRALSEPDISAIDVLARLQLAARRLGHSIQLRYASDELLDLLVLAGLSDVLPPCTQPPVEPQR